MTQIIERPPMHGDDVPEPRGPMLTTVPAAPTLIEAITYRIGPHTTSDDPTRYRSQDEVDHWSALDPIARYRKYLQAAGVWTERLEERVAAKSQRLRTELRDSVVGADDFDVAEMFDAVYHDITPDLARQREQLLAELAKEA